MSRAAMGRAQLVCHLIGYGAESAVGSAILQHTDHGVRDAVSRRMVYVACDQVEHGVQGVMARIVSDVISAGVP